MKFIIILALIIVGIFGFILTSIQITKRNYSSDYVHNPSDYIYVWVFAAIASLGMLYLLISNW